MTEPRKYVFKNISTGTSVHVKEIRKALSPGKASHEWVGVLNPNTSRLVEQKLLEIVDLGPADVDPKAKPSREAMKQDVQKVLDSQPKPESKGAAEEVKFEEEESPPLEEEEGEDTQPSSPEGKKKKKKK